MGYEIHTLAQVFLRRHRAQSAATGANLDVAKKVELHLFKAPLRHLFFSNCLGSQEEPEGARRAYLGSQEPGLLLAPLGSSWLFLALPGSSWLSLALPGSADSPWLLLAPLGGKITCKILVTLAPPGSSWPPCSWLLLAPPPGSPWPPLVLSGSSWFLLLPTGSSWSL